jgi:hypothetical protein
LCTKESRRTEPDGEQFPLIEGVTVAGTVPTQEQLNKIPALAQTIKGVSGVKVNAKVAPAQ